MLLCLEDTFNCTYVNKLQLIVIGEAFFFFKAFHLHWKVVGTDESQLASSIIPCVGMLCLYSILGL